MNSASEVAPPQTFRFEAVKRAFAELLAERPPATAPWSLAKRITFRFVALFLFFGFFPSPFSSIPGVSAIPNPLDWIFSYETDWVGAHLFGLREMSSEMTGSGDRAYHWVNAFCVASAAGIGAVGWSIVARRTKNHAHLGALFRLWLRYLLATSLLSYGIAKLSLNQFPSPSPDDLLEPYGGSSPMHLLWTFMGASSAYTFFGGAAEALAGVLLLWLRTATLGALIAAGVLTNVVMLNFCYDVPVKLYSSELLLMALVVAAPDLGRLANVLVLRRAVAAPADDAKRPRWASLTRTGLKIAFVGYILFAMVDRNVDGWRQYGAGAVRPSLYGIFDVESFTRDGVEVPPLATDTTRWKHVVFNQYPGVTFYAYDDSPRRYRKEADDATTSTLSLKSKKLGELSLHYTRVDADHVTLDGTIDDARVVAQLKRASGMALTSRGFHWVSEYPANW